MVRKVMAGAAEINDLRLIQQEDIIGCMGRMAGRAHPFLYRIMLGKGLFLLHDRVLVTTAAESRHRVLR